MTDNSTASSGRRRSRVQAVNVSAVWTPNDAGLKAASETLFAGCPGLFVRGGRLTINGNFAADLSDPDRMVLVAGKVRACHAFLKEHGEIHHFGQSTGTVDPADLSPEPGALDHA